MDHPLPGKKVGKPRILVVPLDWGLGHATRCIPLVRELVDQGAEPWLAGEDAQEQLLKIEFPQLPFLYLPGYRIRYTKSRRGLVWKMLSQGPKMRRAIQYEHRWLKKMQRQYEFDAVISDNRYGLYHKKIPCIFITHQLNIKSSWGAWTERLLQKRNYNYINRFAQCWVPDLAGENNLAGILSHPEKKPIVPIHYIGPLSRFESSDRNEIKGQLLILLSGPEPQRSMLENKIIAEIAHYDGTATIVRGLPGNPSLVPSTNMIKFYNHLPADELETVMQEAEYVISRSGYSTIMDAVVLQKKCIFIPTPGQTEQEWLAEHLGKKGMATIEKQETFSLNEAIENAAQYNYQIPNSLKSNELLKKVISNFLATLNLRNPSASLG